MPFRPRDGSPLVAITCGGIGEIITEERAHAEIGPALVAMVQALGRKLEGNPCNPGMGLVQTIGLACWLELAWW